MKKTYKQRIPESKSAIDVFKGYDHRLLGGYGTFYETENLSSLQYPLLSPRTPRGLYANTDKCTGIIAKNELCYTDGKYFVIGGVRFDMGLSDEPKDLISMGAYVIILPDKKYINTIDPTDRGDIEHAFTSPGGATFSICDVSGEQPLYFLAQNTAPNAATDGDFWIDTSKEIYTLNVYTRSSGTWGEYSTAAIRVEAEGIGEAFTEGDSIIFDGFASSFTCTDKVSVEGDALSSLGDKERYATVMTVGEGFIVVTGPVAPIVKLLGDANKWFWEHIDEIVGDGATPPTSLTQKSAITLSRKMPIMDFVIECGNRLWGCRYGKADNGETVNEIYASKAGDFKNWNDFRGIDSDSWVALCGSDGPFTGAASYNGHPIFFKENMMYRIYGDVTSAFGYTDVACRGVAPGSGKSLAVVNEVLYYHSRHGICAYDGSLPVSVSDEFGDVRYKNGIAGKYGDRYNVSLEDTNKKRRLFVYDTIKRLWHVESGDVRGISECNGDLYLVSGNNILTSRTPDRELPSCKDCTVLDMESESGWEMWVINGITPVHEYTSYRGTKCICIKYSGEVNPNNLWRWLTTSGETVQYCLPVKGGNIKIPNTNKYMVVTYATDSSNASTLYLRDFSGPTNLVLEKDMSVSRGMWTATKPIELTDAFFNRINRPDYVIFWSNETSTEANIYISDVRFFESLEAAEEYTASVHDVLSIRRDETRVKWYCETGILGTDSPDTKYISRLNIRMSADTGSSVRFFVEYDSSGRWIHAGSVMGRSLGSFCLPLLLQRSDHVRIRIEGEGDCKIYSIVKSVSGGGEPR